MAIITFALQKTAKEMLASMEDVACGGATVYWMNDTCLFKMVETLMDHPNEVIIISLQGVIKRHPEDRTFCTTVKDCMSIDYLCSKNARPLCNTY